MVKGITYTLLIRLKIIWGKGAGAYNKGSFGQSWGCHKLSHLSGIYRRLKTKLAANSPYAPFDSLSILIGDRNAAIFCREKLSFHCRPSPIPVRSGDSDSDPMEIDIDE